MEDEAILEPKEMELMDIQERIEQLYESYKGKSKKEKHRIAEAYRRAVEAYNKRRGWKVYLPNLK